MITDSYMIMPYQRIVLEMTHELLLGKGKRSTLSTAIILRYGIISSKAAVGAAVTEDVSLHRDRKLTVSL